MYVGWRGGITKFAPEAVRWASSMETIVAESWGSEIQEILDRCGDMPDREERQGREERPHEDAATSLDVSFH